MTRRRRYVLAVALPAALAVAAACCALAVRDGAIDAWRTVDRPPRLRPDYAGVVIPPNIAPLNFVVDEPGEAFCVRLRGDAGEPIEVRSDSPKILLPASPWRRLLEANRGGPIHLDVYARAGDGTWRRFQPIANTVAREAIDGYLLYRIIKPLYVLYWDMTIRQRDLKGFDETVVLDNRAFARGCINCHTPRCHQADDMLVQVRAPAGPVMLLGRGRDVSVVNTRTKYNPSPAAYSAWHPSGRLVAFSVNKLRMFCHAVGENRDMWDSASDLGIYLVESNAVKSTSAISDPKRLESWPTWSPDGHDLYFVSAKLMPPTRYESIRFDLMRISYDVDTGQWGKLETVLSAQQAGASITQPRVSPDGRFVLVTASKYGNFPIYQHSADLLLVDVRGGQFRRLDINSDRCDSWHCWSSNGRWIVFSSKRGNHTFARPYISYFDPAGRAHKPFVLPQKDPAFYDSYLRTYNVPELTCQPVRIPNRRWAQALWETGAWTSADGVSSATAKEPSAPATQPATPPGSSPYLE